VLEKLPPIRDPRVLVSEGTVDDAGVYLLNDRTALVFTIDFFTPVVDDPRDFGRISAANALSDVYAMGAKPLMALNVLCFPDGELPPEVMAEILLGGEDTAAEAGIPIIGGHSVSDRELKYGLAVVGTVDPASVVTNAGARPGQTLALTKPLGTGILTTALKQGKLSPDRLVEATAVMRRLNRAAAEAMVEAGAAAATDVTGFGFAGHAVSMAKASRVTFEVDLARLPVMSGVRELLGAGVSPGGLAANREYYRASVACAPEAAAGSDVLYDPQTSGGLLIAVPDDGVDRLRDGLARRGSRDLWIVGRTAPEGPHPLVVR
jgi:selenide,water dikinase